MAEHTQLPWRSDGLLYIDDNFGEMIVITSDGAHVAFVFRDAPADAVHIIRACNAHDDLLAACEALLLEHHLFPRNHGWVCPFCGAECLSACDFTHNGDCPVEAARAAIAKAKGTT